VLEHGAQLIVGDLAYERAFVAERCNACQRIGCRAPGNLAPRSHAPVKLLGPLGVDQPHRPLLIAFAIEEGVVDAGDDIDDGVADGEDVEAGVGHEVHTLVGKGQRRPSFRPHTDQPPGDCGRLLLTAMAFCRRFGQSAKE
jgi:hypothetical protein